MPAFERKRHQGPSFFRQVLNYVRDPVVASRGILGIKAGFRPLKIPRMEGRKGAFRKAAESLRAVLPDLLLDLRVQAVAVRVDGDHEGSEALGIELPKGFGHAQVVPFGPVAGT